MKHRYKWYSVSTSAFFYASAALVAFCFLLLAGLISPLLSSPTPIFHGILLVVVAALSVVNCDTARKVDDTERTLARMRERVREHS